jgi:ankyrin repeat protein
MTKQELFERALENCNLTDLKNVLESDSLLIDLSVNNSQALKLASERGDFELVKYLIENDDRVDPTSQQYAALIISMQENHIDILNYLLKDKRVKANFNKNSLIVVAYFLKKPHLINLLWKEKSVKETLEQDNPFIHSIIIKKETKSKVKNF